MTTQFVMIDGQAFQPVKAPATGAYQLLRMESVKSYILVNPNGRQAWFNDRDIAAVCQVNPSFRFTNNPLRDLNKLARLGLRPFHVDADFDPTGLGTA